MTILDKINTLERGKAQDYQREAFNKAREAMQALCNGLNGGDERAMVAGLLAGLTSEHRYLQDKAIWTLFRALGAFGGLEAGRFTDARNQAAHAACGNLREALGDRIYWPAVDKGDL